VFRTKHIEETEMARAYIDIQSINVDRTRSALDALVATGRHVKADKEAMKVVKKVPQGGDSEIILVFFRLELPEKDVIFSNDEIMNEYARRDLKPADLFAVAAFFEERPGMGWLGMTANTLWKRERWWGSKWYSASFGEESVDVTRCREWEFRNFPLCGIGNNPKFWFAGVHK
jgi:hypothetical protein